MPPDPQLLQFGDNLRRKRQSQHLTQAQLAAACGISTNLISNIELGYNWPSMPIYLKMCDVLFPGKKLLLCK